MLYVPVFFSSQTSNQFLSSLQFLGANVNLDLKLLLLFRFLFKLLLQGG